MLIEGYSFEALVSDKRTYYSVMKNVEVVGEAAYMLTKAFKNSHPEIPWKVVQGMRHVLVHDYATIDDKELYNTAVNDIPVLRNQVELYLKETNWDEWLSVPDDFEDMRGGWENGFRTKNHAFILEVGNFCLILQAETQTTLLQPEYQLRYDNEPTDTIRHAGNRSNSSAHGHFGHRIVQQAETSRPGATPAVRLLRHVAR